MKKHRNKSIRMFAVLMILVVMLTPVVIVGQYYNVSKATKDNDGEAKDNFEVI